MYRAKLVILAFVLAMIFMSFIQMFLDFLALIVNSTDPTWVVVLIVSLTLLFYLKLKAQGESSD